MNILMIETNPTAGTAFNASDAVVGVNFNNFKEDHPIPAADTKPNNSNKPFGVIA